MISQSSFITYYVKKQCRYPVSWYPSENSTGPRRFFTS